VTAGKEFGKPVKVLGENRSGFYPQFSSDGKKVVCLVVPEGGARAGKPEAMTLDVRTGQASAIKGIPDGAVLSGMAFSPDGKRLGYVWFTHDPQPGGVAQKTGNGPPPLFTHHVTVCDADGTNAKEVYSVVAARVFAFDWR